MKSINWTPALVEQLTVWWQAGLSGRDISILLDQKYGLDVSRSGVMGKLHRLGLSAIDRTLLPRIKIKPVSSGKRQKRKKPVQPKQPSPPELQPSKLAIAGTPLKQRGRPQNIGERTTAHTKDLEIRGPVLKPRTKHGRLIDVRTIGNGECRWPYGDPRDSSFHYCGHPVQTEPKKSVYCPVHYAVAFMRPPKKDHSTLGIAYFHKPRFDKVANDQR